MVLGLRNRCAAAYVLGLPRRLAGRSAPPARSGFPTCARRTMAPGHGGQAAAALSVIGDISRSTRDT